MASWAESWSDSWTGWDCGTAGTLVRPLGFAVEKVESGFAIEPAENSFAIDVAETSFESE